MPAVQWLFVTITVLGGKRMRRSLSIVLLLLSCAYNVYAQDSFRNPYNFTYEIEYTSEFMDTIASSGLATLEVRYDAAQKTSVCSVMYKGEQKYQGRILDIQLDKDRQTFVLEKYFMNKHNACLLVARGTGENIETKIGMIYYANQKEDPASEKTCYCLMLKDVDKKQNH